MSLPHGPKSSSRTLGTRFDEARGAHRPTLARPEPGDPASRFGVACQDVMDEVRQRMVLRGFTWD